MAPSNADLDRTPALSDFTALATGTSGPAKDQDKSNKIKDLIQHQEMDLSAPPKLQHSLKSVPGHRSDEDSTMEGIVSISAASTPLNNNNNSSSSNGISKDHEPGTAQSSPLTKETAQLKKECLEQDHSTLDKVVAHEQTQENNSDKHSLHNHHNHSSLAVTSTSSPFKIVNGNGYEHGEADVEEDEDHSNYDNDDYDEGVDFRIEYNQSQPSDEKYRRIKRKLKQVLQRRDSESGSDSVSSLSSDSDASDSSAMEEIQSKRVSPSGTLGKAKMNRGASNTATTATIQHPKKTTTKSPGASPATGTSRATGTKETKTQTVASTPSTITNVGSATQKPKRIHQTNKQRPALAKVRRVQALERDEAGNIKLPVTVGIITILSIGHVVYDREAFHNDRYIWPVGYKMSRSYNSMIDPHNQTTYTCSVIDDGEAPKFQIDAEDQPGKPIIAGTATGAWTHVVKAANAIRKRDHSNSASGPDYYGFSNATIAKMIQDLPGVEKCQSYIMQRFEEPSVSTSTSAKAGSSGTSGDKRKASALTTKIEEGGNHLRDDERQDAKDIGEDGDDDDDDDDAYTSLGTPGKKKTRVSSPKIRHAGFDMSTASSVETVEPLFAKSAHVELDGDEPHSDLDNEGRELSRPNIKSPSEAPLHPNTAPSDSQPPVIVAAASGDSEIIDIEEDHDSEVDVGMDEDVSMKEQDDLS
ncbi:hypothetical protein BGZ80_005414 [Entomortierella chlamydospora]|uniref:Uncharacterized protein n=1 Tax=Entomortierella chlamydospora TaxID=101097 RepID=A0A9P6MZR9_9FUNG|nr:hypothetical protein BGZ79_002723 [Entomortierella chlamydospora]KAG0019686.1 hypothetical protein BGZ80_005414 [Entomortierella chlamydospora]